MKKRLILLLTVIASLLQSGIAKADCGCEQTELTRHGTEIPSDRFHFGNGYYCIINQEMAEVVVIDDFMQYYDPTWWYGEGLEVPEKVSFDGTDYTVVGVGRDTFTSGPFVKLPNSVEFIEEDCLNSIHANEFDFPTSLKTIGNNCFNRWDHIQGFHLPAALREVDCSSFSYNKELTTVIFGNTLRRIGSKCFTDNPMLKEVYLPNSLYFIGDGCFSNCESLEKVKLPRYLPYEHLGEKLDLEMFNDCPNIRVIEWDSTTPAELPRSFKEVDRSKCVVVVSDGCKEIYEANDYWKEFNIVEKSEYDAGVGKNPFDQSPTTEERFYNLDGFSINSVVDLDPGTIYIRVSPDGVAKMIK